MPGIKISSVLVRIVILASILSGTSMLYAQVAGAQFDTHPMHWARFWARGLFDRNLLYCPIWNIGNLTDSGLSPYIRLRWPGHNGLTYGKRFHFYLAY